MRASPPVPPAPRTVRPALPSGLAIAAMAAAAGFLAGRVLPRAAPSPAESFVQCTTPEDVAVLRTELESQALPPAPAGLEAARAQLPPPSAPETPPGPGKFPPLPDAAPVEQEIARLRAQQAEALEREGRRIEDRMNATRDPNELAILTQLEDKMAALEEVQVRMEQATTDEQRMALTREIQPLIGEVMQLHKADRQYRLTELGRSLGLDNGADMSRLIDETERIYRETQRDLAPFLSRGGPFKPAAPEPFRTTPPPELHPHP